MYYGDKKAKVVEQINNEEFRVSTTKGKTGIMDYAEIIRQLTHIEEEDSDKWIIEDIIDHRWGKGSRKGQMEVCVKWQDEDEPTWEPMKVIKEDDPITLAKYAQNHNLQDYSAWKWTKRYLCLKKTSLNKLVQLYAKKSKSTPKYKFGERVPRTVAEALKIDQETNSTGWTDAINKEIDTLVNKYACFEILKKGVPPPPGYQFIKLLWTFDIKHDGRKRARLVGGGHMTEKLDFEEVTSSMVRFENILLAFIAMMTMITKLKCLMGDVNSAYIQAYTKEMVYAVAGPEFGSIAGCVLLCDKALYGLQSSGNEWHSKFADDISDMGFVPTRADPDLWIKENTKENCYEYLAVFVDDIIVFAVNPMEIFDTLKKKYKYEFKDISEPEFYNGADIYQDENTAQTCISARTYLKNIIPKIEETTSTTLKNYGAPMITDYHPELDDSPLLDAKGVKIYQMLIGCAQWAVTLGRYDIQYATNTLARYASCPRINHYKNLLKLFGYLKHHKKYRIEVDVHKPCYDGLKFLEHDWKAKYPGCEDEIPDDMPPPKTEEVWITCYVDASHASDIVTRRSVTGILLCVNCTPVKWYSKRQNTVESSTYGSEFVAARIACELILEFRYKLRMLGFRLTEPAVLLVDNESVVKNTTLPSSSLKKKHNAIAYHKVRECVAAGIIKVAFLRSQENRADILTKPLAPQLYYKLLEGVLFRKNSL